MRVLVTGAGGFVGRHAIHELEKAGHEIVPLHGPGHSQSGAGISNGSSIDLRDGDAVSHLIKKISPDACLHLGGIAFVPYAWEHPQDAFAINTIGTINVLEAIRTHAAACRLLVVTSAQIYGHRARAEEITEDDAPDIDSIYAASKWAADMSTLLYAKRYSMQTMTARPCNHIGPGQSESFAVSSFARQLLEISLKRRDPVIRVGNLESEREFTDVRDIVRAYRLLLEKGQPGNAYNITSGKFYRIQAIFDLLCEKIGVAPVIEIDPALFRPTDAQPKLSTKKIREHTGWKTQIDIADTLTDIVSDFRQRLS